MAGLEDLYREIILDHYRSPRHRGQLETPPAVKAEGFNPLCGDEVVVYLAVDDGVVSDIAKSLREQLAFQQQQTHGWHASHLRHKAEADAAHAASPAVLESRFPIVLPPSRIAPL